MRGDFDPSKYGPEVIRRYRHYHGFTGKPFKAFILDLSRTRGVPKSFDTWRRNSRYYDWPGIDTYANVFRYKARSSKSRIGRRGKAFSRYTRRRYKY